ncbi:MAG: hypothetical protein JWR83_3563 [Aeromicrobium sp.]|nr:hypothetical protein [Aeromicrobium sp.]
MTDNSQAPGAATIRIGFKNVLRATWLQRTHRWVKRVPLLRRELVGSEGMHASVYLFVEVKGRMERASLGWILRGWDLARTRGTNKAFSDPAVHRIVEAHSFLLGSTTRQRRRAAIVTYEHLASGVRWTVATTHLSSSGGTTPDAAAASRSAEAQTLAGLCAQFGVDVIAADFNNSVVRPGTPRAILESAGYTDWRSVIAVQNADHDSHYEIGKPNPRTGKHLDGIYLGPRVTALDGRLQITEPGSSDHFGLVCTISITA